MNHPKMQWLSVGKDGSVWATGIEDGTVYRLFGDAGHIGWVANKVGKARMLVAVDWSSAWCINDANQIWRVTDWHNLAEPGTWQKIATHSGEDDAHYLTIEDDGTIWYSDTEGTLHRRKEDRWVKPRVGKAKQFVVESDKSIIGFGGGPAYAAAKAGEQGFHYGDAPIRSLTVRPMIAVGEDGCVYGQAVGGNELFKQQGWDPQLMGSEAKLIATHRFGEGTPESEIVRWCLTTSGDVWKATEGFGWPGDTRPVAGHGFLWEPFAALPPSIEEFDRDYDTLSEAVWQQEGHIADRIDKLHDYCERLVAALHDYLLDGQYIAPPEVKTQIAYAIKSWNRFDEDLAQAQDPAVRPLWGPPDGAPSGPHLGLAMIEIEKLRGHYKHLRQFAAMQSGVSIMSYLPSID